MKQLLILIVSLSLFGCSNGDKQGAQQTNRVFDAAQWQEKDENGYLYREYLYKDVLYNDTVRDLSKAELLNLLGKPDREQDNHLYYRIDEDKLGLWTMHAKTMVIKMENDTTVAWIKVHD